jgi:hypothetical protein
VDSNHRPPACQAGALTPELRAYGFEIKALDERTVYQPLNWGVNEFGWLPAGGEGVSGSRLGWLQALQRLFEDRVGLWLRLAEFDVGNFDADGGLEALLVQRVA